MSKNLLKVAIIAAGLMFSINSFAKEESGFFTGIQAGTLGAGLNVGYNFNDMFGLRANINGLKVSRDVNVGDLKYNGNAKLLTAGILADYHPFENGFRLSAGAYYNDNKIYGHGYSTKTYYGLDPNDFGYEDASVKYNKFSPYLGVGYDVNITENLSFVSDLGVLYQGKGKVKNSTVCYSQFVCTILSDKLNEENESQKYKIQDKADKLQFYPVLSIGLSYSF